MGERVAFSRLIANLMTVKPHTLIWMDETTYSSVQMKAKSWATKQNPVLHAKNNRQMRVTVFGAISPCLVNGRVMRLAKSTNKHDFMSFLVDIKTSILPRYRRQLQILLFDGARAHTCHDSQAFMEGYFKPLQIPVMSCEFNCKHFSVKHLESIHTHKNTFHSQINKINQILKHHKITKHW